MGGEINCDTISRVTISEKNWTKRKQAYIYILNSTWRQRRRRVLTNGRQDPIHPTNSMRHPSRRRPTPQQRLQPFLQPSSHPLPLPLSTNIIKHPHTISIPLNNPCSPHQTAPSPRRMTWGIMHL